MVARNQLKIMRIIMKMVLKNLQNQMKKITVIRKMRKYWMKIKLMKKQILM